MNEHHQSPDPNGIRVRVRVRHMEAEGGTRGSTRDVGDGEPSTVDGGRRHRGDREPGRKKIAKSPSAKEPQPHEVGDEGSRRGRGEDLGLGFPICEMGHAP
jgi:hypothetical protein